MTERKKVSTSPAGAEAVAEQLARILRSKGFKRSRRMSALLEFLARRHKPSEAEIARGVFGRDHSFDPKLDPIVRVEVRRLRRLLDEYYRTIGARDRVVIELPPRGYQLTVSERDDAAVCASPLKVALLPFENAPEQAGASALSFGITEEIRNRLSQLSTVCVTSRIAAPTGSADAIIEGSVRAQDDDVRVSVQLTDAASGCHVWSGTFKATAEESFATEEELAAEIVNEAEQQLRQIRPS